MPYCVGPVNIDSWPMARLLIALGADPTLPNSLGQTALAYAHAWAPRHVPLLDLLIKEGCDPEEPPAFVGIDEPPAFVGIDPPQLPHDVEGQVQEAMRGNSYGIHAMRYY